MHTLTRLLPIALAAALLAPAPVAAQKVFLNPSNQIHNAVAGGGNEATYAVINANLCRDILAANGFTLRVDDDFDNAPSNANSWGAQVFVSVHSNAGGGHGTETLWGVTSGSQTIADRIQDGLLSKLPYQSRGLKDGTWAYVLRTTRMPACLAEVVFHDCASSSGYTGHPPSESAYLKSASGQQAIGAGMAAGVCTHFNKSCGTAPGTDGSLKGVVYTNGDINHHVAPATVRLSTGASTTYDGSAVWSFTVPAGSYSITGSAAGYKTATKTCPAVTAGQTAWCSIDLEPDTTSAKGFVKGVVYKNGDTTDHVAPANVRLNSGESRTYDGSAVWSFEVAPGTYTVTATAEGYQTASRECAAVVAGQTTWCSVEVHAEVIPPSGFLEGVVYRNGDPADLVAPATVALGTGESKTYDGTALWAFELVPGTYSVFASAEGYEPATKQCGPVVDGQRTRCDVELAAVPAADAGIVPGPDDAGTVEPDAGAAADAGAPTDAATATDAGSAPRAVPTIDDGACGCSAASNGLLGLLAVPAILAARVRPRRRRSA